jgi:hypothetical protein
MGLLGLLQSVRKKPVAPRDSQQEMKALASSEVSSHFGKHPAELDISTRISSFEYLDSESRQ